MVQQNQAIFYFFIFFFGGGSFNDWTLKLLRPCQRLFFSAQDKELELLISGLPDIDIEARTYSKLGLVIRRFKRWKRGFDTVDGSEIRHPPVEVGSLSHSLQGFKNIPGGLSRRISEPINSGAPCFCLLEP